MACRVVACSAQANLDPESLCPECARIKFLIRSKLDAGILPWRHLGEVGDSGMEGHDCSGTACLCSACDAAIAGVHLMYRNYPSRKVRGERHFHPRCHELWEETAARQYAP